MMKDCYCGNNKPYSDCCEPIHLNPKKAITAQQLMQARYSAHVLQLVDFVVATTAESTRKEIDLSSLLVWLKETDWQKLEIKKAIKGQIKDVVGKVEFKAYYNEKNNKKALKTHHELSTFEKKGGQWYFVDGTIAAPQKIKTKKIAKNSLCPCQSGKKYKRCCGKK